jgi:hypothetical protein
MFNGDNCSKLPVRISCGICDNRLTDLWTFKAGEFLALAGPAPFDPIAVDANPTWHHALLLRANGTISASSLENKILSHISTAFRLKRLKEAR